MTDKVQKIKQWISKEQEGLMDAQGNFEYPEHQGAYNVLCNLDAYIDSLQEEPVSKDFEMALAEMVDKAQRCVVEPWVVAAQWKDELIKLAKSEEPVSERFAFKAIPRLLEMIEPTDRAKAYIAKLAGTLEAEGYSTDAKIVMESLKIMNGEKVPMATMDSEPVSEELEEAAKNVGQKYFPDENNIWARPNYEAVKVEYAFKDGAKWQKANLWKSADGDDLPEIDIEVIVLTQPYPLENSEYAVSFAHRPNPDGWDGKSLTTGEVEHYIPKTYGKGGWNIPDIVYWLDVELPKEIER